MENAIVIGILAALALACEWWLRRHEAKKQPRVQDIPTNALRAGSRGPMPATRRSPTGELPFDALRGKLPAARRPPTVSAN